MSGAIGLLLGVMWFLGWLLLLAGMSLMLMTDVILCGFPAWAALAAWSCVDEGLSSGIVWCGGRWGLDGVSEDMIKVI